MDDPKLLGMVGGGLAFILLLITLLLKRIRGNKADEDEPWSESLDDASSDFSNIEADLYAGLDEATVKTEAVDMGSTAEMMAEPMGDDLGMGDTQIESPDSGDNLEDTVFNLESAKAKAEEVESDDVIAEADVYLAYGIYQQAEELLNSAIDQNPQRDDYRMKLLETHYAAKDAVAFEQLAEDLKTRKGDDKTYWGRVTAMGMELCPQSLLFSGSDALLSDFDADALLPDKPQTTDLDLDAGDDSVKNFDLGLDDDGEKTQVLSDSLDLDAITPEEKSLSDDLDLAGDLDDIAGDLGSELEDESLSDDTSADLEFDLGELDDMDESVADVEDNSIESAELDIDDDFSLDFDAADLGFEETEDDTEEVGLDTGLDLGEDLTEELGSSADDSLELDMGEIEIDGDELDLEGMELDDGLAEIDSEAADDLSSLNTEVNEMDLGVDTLDDLSDDDGEFNISELSEDVDEVSTKLDLAKAYIDMGDNDGARSILEEVKTEGNEEQQQQAEELLQQAS